MHRLGLFSIALLLATWVVGEIPPNRPEDADPAGPWRRTATGWQPARSVLRPDCSRNPAVHPSVVALFELFACGLAGVAMGGGSAQKC